MAGKSSAAQRDAARDKVKRRLFPLSRAPSLPPRRGVFLAVASPGRARGHGSSRARKARRRARRKKDAPGSSRAHAGKAAFAGSRRHGEKQGDSCPIIPTYRKEAGPLGASRPRFPPISSPWIIGSYHRRPGGRSARRSTSGRAKVSLPHPRHAQTLRPPSRRAQPSPPALIYFRAGGDGHGKLTLSPSNVS